MREIRIRENESGQRLDKFLAKYMGLAPKSFFYKMMRKKNITLNGKKAQGNEQLKNGDVVKLFLSDETIEKFTEKQSAVKRGTFQKEKLDILREADAIFREEIAKAGLQRKLWQYFAVLTNMRSVGVMGDERTYDYTVALRSVNSNDAMTAEWSKIPYEVLEAASSRIVNEVKFVNRIVYDITSKPPATIEWE